MRNGEPIHVCGGRWIHRDDDCHCPCYFCRLYSQAHSSPGQSRRTGAMIRELPAPAKGPAQTLSSGAGSNIESEVGR